MKRSIQRFFFLPFTFAAGLALAVPGDIDATFGSGGTVMLPLPSPSCDPGQTCFGIQRGVLVRPDGRILAVTDVDYNTPEMLGHTSAVGLVLHQRLPDGAPDPAFGTGGMARPFPSAQRAQAHALLPDGKLIAGIDTASGLVGIPGTSALMRLTAEGNGDPTFGNSGLMSIDRSVLALALQSDGKFVVATYGTNAQPVNDIVLRRYMPDGQQDMAFGSGGSVAVSIPNVATAASFTPRGRPDGTFAFQIRVQPDDRLVIAATIHSSADSILVTRFNRDGDRDTTFNGTGTLQLEAGTALAMGDSVGKDVLAFQSNGRVLVSGKSGNVPYVFGITSAGFPDPSFGLGGRTQITGMPGASASPAAIVVQPDDRIVAVGSNGQQRFTPFGWRDASFRQTATPASGRVFLAAQGEDILALYGGGGGGTLRRTDGSDQLDVFGDARNFVMAQYRDFLDREGDAGGIDYWSNAIATGASTRGQVTESFFNSSEFQDAYAPVARLYFAYFLRTPDYGGLHYWVAFARAGASLGDVSDVFASSGEFQSRYGTLDNSQFVDLVYRNVLGRPPDSLGYAYWKGQLDSGTMTRGQVMTGFSESPEFVGAIRSEVFTTLIYMAMLQRTPDDAGVAYWVQQLDGGAPGLALIDAFLGSQEYRERFLP